MQKRRIPTWGILWIVGLLAVLVIFFANKTAVDKLFDSVGLNRILYPDGGNRAPSVLRPAPVSEPSPSAVALENKNTKEKPLAPPASNDEVPTDALPPDTASAEPPADQPAETAPVDRSQEKSSDKLLFFLKMDPEGRLTPSPFKRELQAGLTPLAATLKALMLGPTLQEKNEGALNLIPDGSRLLSLRVKDKTAFLSFNEEFQHNSQGLDGLAGQLKEIVWTATQFSSVDRVQILINGQYKDTLGEEGMGIGKPLDRSSFR